MKPMFLRAGLAQPSERAMLHTLRARIEANCGRLQDALSEAAQAEELLGEHPVSAPQFTLTNAAFPVCGASALCQKTLVKSSEM